MLLPACLTKRVGGSGFSSSRRDKVSLQPVKSAGQISLRNIQNTTHKNQPKDERSSVPLSTSTYTFRRDFRHKIICGRPIHLHYQV